MKNAKTLICLSLISLTTVFSATGCVSSYGSDTQGGEVEQSELEKIMSKYNHLNYEYSGEPCTITMSHWSGIGANLERNVTEAVLKGFHLRYPTIQVKLDVLSDYENTYPNRLAAGNVHDVFMMPDGSFPAWAMSNRCLNLDPFIASSEILNTEELYKTSLTRYRFNAKTGMPGDTGTQLALPRDVCPNVMFYNKNAFDEMGVPYPAKDGIMTIEQATEMWKKLNKKSGDQTIRYAVAGLSIEGLVWSAGGDFLNKDRTAFPDDPATLAGLKKGYQYYQDAFVTHKITPPAEFAINTPGEQLFSQQRVACFIGLKAHCSAFRQLSFDWDAVQIPAFTTNQTKNGWSGSIGYSVYNGSKNPEAAWKLVEYITSKEGQEILGSTGFQIPLYKEIGLQEDFLAREEEAGPSNYKCFLEAAENQSYGTWQYRTNNKWKMNGYDVTSEMLLSQDPETRLTVDEFLAKAKVEVTKNL